MPNKCYSSEKIEAVLNQALTSGTTGKICIELIDCVLSLSGRLKEVEEKLDNIEKE